MNSDFTIAVISGVLLLFMLVCFIITFFIINQRKKEKLLLEKKILTKIYKETLLQTQLEIQEQTLKNISEEIHDNIGQVLSVVKLNLNTFPENLEPAIKNKLSHTEILLSKAIDDLRDLSQSMHGDNFAAIGLQAALEQELRHLQKTGKYNTRLQVGGNKISLPVQKEMVLFRIAQEALNNAIKHSAAKNIEIELLYGPTSLILQVTDDGKGFDATQTAGGKSGIGLKSMHNRAALIGGCFLVHSGSNNGTTIKIEIPTT